MDQDKPETAQDGAKKRPVWLLPVVLFFIIIIAWWWVSHQNEEASAGTDATPVDAGGAEP